MSVLVTGGAGYIGSHMVIELLGAGDCPVIIDNLSTGHRRAVPDGVPLIIGDVGDQELVSSIIRQYGVNAIAHFAGSIVVPESIADPLGYYLNNTVQSHTLIECAVRARVKHFIFSSTAAVYGTPGANPVFEDAPVAPISPYGSSKMMTEIMLRDAGAAYGLKHVILRYFNVGGADLQGRSGQSTPSATHLIKVAAQTALGQRPYMEVFGTDYPTTDGTCVRDYIHVTDLVRAHVAALTYLREGLESQILNCGYGRGFSVLEVIDAVKRVSGSDFEVREAPRRAGDPVTLVAGARRLPEVLGWHPEFDDLDTIVTHALAWETRLAQISEGAQAILE